jgi:DNA-directed RNA polymerase subunit beta'
MLRELRRVAGKRDDLIAKEKAKAEAERALLGPAAGIDPLSGSPRRRRRPTDEAAE